MRHSKKITRVSGKMDLRSEKFLEVVRTTRQKKAL
jgi:hypothetical protein